MTVVSTIRGTNMNEDVEFLEKALEAKKIVNELTSWVGEKETYEALSVAYDALDTVLSPICPDCEVRAVRFITSPAELYDPDMVNYPGGTSRAWTGEWYCPKCRHTVAFGEKWWCDSSTSTKKGEER